MLNTCLNITQTHSLRGEESGTTPRHQHTRPGTFPWLSVLAAANKIIPTKYVQHLTTLELVVFNGYTRFVNG